MKHQRGLTLIELSLSLAVVLSITAFIAGNYLVNRSNARMDTLRTELMTVASAVGQMARAGNIAGITTATVGQSRLLPDGNVFGVGAGTVISNAMGGRFEIASAAMPGVSATGLRIRVTGLEDGPCVEAAMMMAERFDAVSAGGTVVKNRLLATPIRASRALAQTGCTANASQLDFLLLP